MRRAQVHSCLGNNRLVRSSSPLRPTTKSRANRDFPVHCEYRNVETFTVPSEGDGRAGEKHDEHGRPVSAAKGLMSLAHQLYGLLLKPVDAGWRDAKSLVVATMEPSASFRWVCCQSRHRRSARKPCRSLPATAMCRGSLAVMPLPCYDIGWRRPRLTGPSSNRSICLQHFC